LGNSYREKFFQTYNSTHVGYLDSDDKTKADWFADYVQINYLPVFSRKGGEGLKILEIGCNKGFALAALAGMGFKNLYGVDMSPVDIKTAKSLVPSATLQCVDAHPYLRKNRKAFDFILLKAVLEHVPKDKVVPLLESMREGLKDGGQVIIDVPNMDWIVAQHERYMDFTHENGFTRESLAQVMRNVFSSVSVGKGKPVLSKGPRGWMRDILRPVFIRAVNFGLRLVGEGAPDIWWDCRSIIGIGEK